MGGTHGILPDGESSGVKRNRHTVRLKSKKPTLADSAEEKFMEAWAVGDYVVSRIW